MTACCTFPSLSLDVATSITIPQTLPQAYETWQLYRHLHSVWRCLKYQNSYLHYFGTHDGKQHVYIPYTGCVDLKYFVTSIVLDRLTDVGTGCGDVYNTKDCIIHHLYIHHATVAFDLYLVWLMPSGIATILDHMTAAHVHVLDVLDVARYSTILYSWPQGYGAW